MNKIFSFFLISLFVFLPRLPGDESSDNDREPPSASLTCPYVYASVNVITGEYCENQTDLRLGGIASVSLRRSYSSLDPFASGWHFNHPNFPAFEPNNEEQSTNSGLSYRFDEQKRLMQIQAEKEGMIFQSLNISYNEDQDFLDCIVHSEEGHSVNYRFIKSPSGRLDTPHLLKKVTTSSGKEIEYEYRDHPRDRRKLLSRKIEQQGRYLNTEYYDSFINSVGDKIIKITDLHRDPRIGKVKLQKGPVGGDSEPIITARFFYHQDCTEVYDALNNKTIYRSKNNNLTVVEHYLDDSTIYRSEKFFWNELQQLVSKTIEDGNRKIIRCQTFEYDLYGNIVKQTLYGNLTGTKECEILLDDQGFPIENGVESYSTLLRYSDDLKHLLLFQTYDNGTTERYFYTESPEKLRCKLTYDDDSLRIREFYEYDAFGNLALRILDDGISENPDDMTAVTERKITRFIPKQDYPAKGLPILIEEKYFDFCTGTEMPLKQTILTYSSKGEVLQQDVYDGERTLQITTSYTYDAYGNLIKKIDSDGKIHEISYDSNGNPLEIIENNLHVTNQYDFSNRLIRRDVQKENMAVESTRFKYDYRGNPISKTDYMGNETLYQYDALGRLTTTIDPAIIDSNLTVAHPITSQTYDVLDHVTSVIQPNGETTYTTYNIRGKPIKIIYSDGTTENYEYNRDGSLRKFTYRNGCYTTFERDFQGRAIKEEKFDPHGDILTGTFRTYSTFHLIEEADLFGKTSMYSYDGAGRQIKITQIKNQNTRHSEIGYDASGYPFCRKDYYGVNPEDCILSCTERNSDQKTVAISIKNNQGETLKRKELHNNRSEDENSQNIHYFYDHYNSIGQNVLQSTLVDSQGCSIITTFDALKRPVKIEKKNGFSDLISSKEIYYDLGGNKAKEIHSLLKGSTICSFYTCAWTYGPGKKLLTTSERMDNEKERTTYYSYSSGGRLETITKPDGVTLLWTYNQAGLPTELQSSDHSIFYQYTYDAQQRLVQIDDRIQNQQTFRDYNEDNQLIKEVLGNGLSLSSKYDLCGRKIETIFPDQSKTLYEYDAAYLRSIKRISPSGSTLYQHRYAHYSLTGKILEESLIGDLGLLHHNYDTNDLLKSIDSPYWSQHIVRDSQHQIQQLKTEDPNGIYHDTYAYDTCSQLTNENNQEYTYDSLRNRIEINKTGIEFNSHGEPSSQENKTYEYDSNGNLITIRESSQLTHLHYDALNRLIHVSKEKEYSTSYTYDSFNRRLSSHSLKWNSRTENWINPIHTHYLYDGMNEIGSSDELGTMKDLRILGIGLGAEIGSTVALEIGDSIYAPIHDHRGSISCLINIQTASPVEWYRYSAFGTEQNQSLSGNIINPWRFSGKRMDENTGFVLFGHRYYNPETGRWITKDPLGNPESVNRNIYNLNDPINRIDPLGLSSFTQIWTAIQNFFQSSYEMFQRIFTTIKNYVSMSDTMHPVIDKVGQAIFGKPFLLLSGFYSDVSETGVHGKGEINDKVRITLINGILNARTDYKESLDVISEAHGGANIHFIFDATGGWCWDMLKSLLVKCGYISPQAHMIADTWRQMIDEMGGVEGGGMIYHYAHSIGGAHTQAALRLMTPEEKNMINVYTFGSPTHVKDDFLNEIRNYVSVRDGVCLLDPVGYFSGLFGMNETVIPVGDWLGIPLIDHTLNNGSYIEIIKLLGLQLLEIYVL